MNFWEYLNARAERIERRWELKQLAKAQRIAAGVTWTQLVAGVTERQWVTIGVFAVTASMLKMAEVHRELWNVDLFKTLLTLVVGTGLINAVVGFWFSANKADDARADLDAKRSDTTRAAFEAVTATAQAGADKSDPDALREGDDVTLNRKEPQ